MATSSSHADTLLDSLFPALGGPATWFCFRPPFQGVFRVTWLARSGLLRVGSPGLQPTPHMLDQLCHASDRPPCGASAVFPDVRSGAMCQDPPARRPARAPPPSPAVCVPPSSPGTRLATPALPLACLLAARRTTVPLPPRGRPHARPASAEGQGIPTGLGVLFVARTPKAAALLRQRAAPYIVVSAWGVRTDASSLEGSVTCATTHVTWPRLSHLGTSVNPLTSPRSLSLPLALPPSLTPSFLVFILFLFDSLRRTPLPNGWPRLLFLCRRRWLLRPDASRAPLCSSRRVHHCGRRRCAGNDL